MSSRVIKAVLFLLVSFSLADIQAATSLVEQRRNFQLATKALERQHATEFLSLKPRLKDYPLYVDLDYADHIRRLSQLTSDEARHFAHTYSYSPLAGDFSQAWLKQIARRQQWRDYINFYELVSSYIDSDELQCYYQWARYRTGQEQAALQATKELWLVGRSQSAACDPLFDRWKAAGYLTKALIWQRACLAVEKGQYYLASYLAGQLSPTHQKIAALWKEVRQDPQTLRQYSRFQLAVPEIRQVIADGLAKLARRDARAAAKLWDYYSGVHRFTQEEKATALSEIATMLAVSHDATAVRWLDKADAAGTDPKLIEWRLRYALGDLNWGMVNQWVKRMPITEDYERDRWEYWQARAMEQLSGAKGPNTVPQTIYHSLSERRSYYGFLASEHLAKDYAIIHQPVQYTAEEWQQLTQNSGMLRAKEFYALDRMAEARQQFKWSTKDYTPRQLAMAAKLVQQWGWHSQAIFTVAAAKEWDDLTLRFPVLYRKEVLQNTRIADIETQWVFAIIRGESAFIPTIKSPKGAVGLMQLLPDTARQVARLYGHPIPNAYDLQKPAINVLLGTSYLNQLLKRYGGNRVLATAAYNAGPGKVSQWIKKNEHLPMDVWIESIPYKETRQYVQNITAYTAIYAHFLQKPVNLDNKGWPLLENRVVY